MKAVIQRVLQASVSISGNVRSAINKGLMIFVGIQEDDTEEDMVWLSQKICSLRIFDDADNIMNLSIKETRGEILLVSQFTLMARVKKGNRPSYIDAAKPTVSIPIYEHFIRILTQELGKEIQTGEFGADMQIALINDGPVTIVIDTKNRH